MPTTTPLDFGARAGTEAPVRCVVARIGGFVVRRATEMGLVKIDDRTWLNPDEIVGAVDSQPVVILLVEEIGIKVYLSGGHEMEFVGESRQVVLKLLATITRPASAQQS